MELFVFSSCVNQLCKFKMEDTLVVECVYLNETLTLWSERIDIFLGHSQPPIS